MKQNKIPGLGRAGLSISESESARNFMDKCVDEKCSAIFFLFRENNNFLISRMDLASGGSRNSLGAKTTKFGPKNTKSVILNQNDQNASIASIKIIILH